MYIYFTKKDMICNSIQ